MSLPLHFFDRAADFAITEPELPHWSQAGAISFITWRTDDSIPREVSNRWRVERFQWLRRRHINPESADWKEQLLALGDNLNAEFYRHFSRQWHEELDRCTGACVLRRNDLSKIISDSLQHFDGDRYLLTDFVVMPNHVHVLASFPSDAAMLTQCESWKHFTATQINRALRQKGRFWQQDAFDHLVRSLDQFEYLRRYVVENPEKAGILASEAVVYSKDLSQLSRRP